MTASRLLRHGLLSAAIFSGAASAIGFGEITLHSRIGEALRADIPVFATGEALNTDCFSLGSIPNADFPVITAARMRLVHTGQDYRLIITGDKSINEPVILVSLRAHCGADVQRDYVLLPTPPVVQSNNIEPPVTVASPAPHDVPPRRSLTENLDEQLSANSDEAIRPTAKPRPKRPSQSTVVKPKKPLPRETLAGIPNGQDRIILGAALGDLPASSAGDPLAPVNELDERLLKMETTLHLLNQEVDKLNTAVALSAESRTMQKKLQDMQARQATPGIQAATPEAPARPSSRHNDWLELLFGLLLGGSISAGVAHWISRRQDKTRPFNAPPPRITKPRKASI